MKSLDQLGLDGHQGLVEAGLLPCKEVQHVRKVLEHAALRAEFLQVRLPIRESLLHHLHLRIVDFFFLDKNFFQVALRGSDLRELVAHHGPVLVVERFPCNVRAQNSQVLLLLRQVFDFRLQLVE